MTSAPGQTQQPKKVLGMRMMLLLGSNHFTLKVSQTVCRCWLVYAKTIIGICFGHCETRVGNVINKFQHGVLKMQ